ncbi:MAG: response regulator [Gemmatimonadaceae bacterium]|nr:response regulator [Gemmatimonadaceae bacterium]
MHRHSPPWHRQLVRLGQRRAHILITLFSIVASVLMTGVFFIIFEGTAEDAPAYFIPAVVVPAVVAPLASGWVLRLAFALESAYAQLAVQTAQLEALLAALPVGVMELSREREIRSANGPAAALLDHRISGAPWDAIFVDADAKAAFLRETSEANPPTPSRWRWRDRAGRVRVVDGFVAPIVRAKTVTGAVLVVVDVTQRDALDQALARAKQLELVGRMAGGLAHDFNNLLTIVRANLVTIRAGDTGAPVQAIDDAAARGARLTRRLLAISGRDVHTPAPHPVTPMITESLELLSHLLPSEIHLLRPASLPALRVTVDRDAIEQALLNVVVNARDALSSGGDIAVTAEERVTEERRWLVIGVRDNGDGMPADVLARATEPFFSTKPSHLGTGLGLSLVHETMERHHGRLVLHSVPAVGTLVELWLPDPEPITGAYDGVDAAAPAATTAEAGAPITLLLVEDEAPVREATVRILRRVGYEVIATESVAEARTVLAAREVAMVLSDVMMPDETGLDLLRSLRAERRTIPVLLISGYAADEVEHTIASDPYTAFLAKPWSVDELQRRVAELLPARGSATPPGAVAPMPARPG